MELRYKLEGFIYGVLLVIALLVIWWIASGIGESMDRRTYATNGCVRTIAYRQDVTTKNLYTEETFSCKNGGER